MITGDFDKVIVPAALPSIMPCVPGRSGVAGNAADVVPYIAASYGIAPAATTALRYAQQIANDAHMAFAALGPIKAFAAMQEQMREYDEVTAAPTRCLRGRRARGRFLDELGRMDDDSQDDDASFIKAVHNAWLQVLRAMLDARAALAEVNRAARRAEDSKQIEHAAYESHRLARLRRSSKNEDMPETIRQIIAGALAPRAPQRAPSSGISQGCRLVGLIG